MQLTDMDIEEYQDICRKVLSVEVTPEQAREELAVLILQVQMVYRPMTFDELESITNRQLELAGNAKRT